MSDLRKEKCYSRRDLLRTMNIGLLSLAVPAWITSCRPGKKMKRHIVSLSFDDGFEKSSIRTADIYEKYDLKACINVVATAHKKSFESPGEYHQWPVGDFQLWNDLKRRGHEIMPHGTKHANLKEMEFEKARELILQCFDIFSNELEGFDPKEAVFNFPYNASSPELETWLEKQVKAYRTGGGPINPLPFIGQSRLICTSFGPENIDLDLEQKVDNLLTMPSGWLIYNTHGLDDEGWGPMSSSFLEELLGRLVEIDSVDILPVGAALDLARA